MGDEHRAEWAMENVKGKRILDIGGLGTNDALVHRRFADKECFCVDISEAIINAGIKNRVQGNALELPFKKDVFDSVCAFEILEHVWNAKLLIEEANRVLKKGGMLYLTTPNPYDFKFIMRFVLRGRSGMGIKTHKQLYTFDSLEKMMKDSGFNVEKFETLILRLPVIGIEFGKPFWPFRNLGITQCIIARKIGKPIKEVFS